MGKQVKRGVNVYVDQTQAQKALDVLQLKFAMVEKSLQSLENEGRKGSAVWEATERRFNSLKNELSGLTKTFGINELSQRQLYALQEKYNRLLKNANPQTAKYKEYAKSLDIVKVRLDELKRGSNATEKAIGKLDNTVKVHQSSLGRLADKFNKYQALVFGFVASLTGVIFSIKSLIKQYAELEDKFADVRKTTGLTIEQVKELDESLKKYDTRTSREQLLLLARDAGKLGIEGKDNIEEFVKAADKIRVALGEDLGEDAIQNIGKIADVFGLVKDMGFGDSLNAIGSAINDLGQSSTANEAFLVEFAHRMGGVASQANISIQNILGFASALDQAGQNVEMSATAVQQFLMKMLSEPAKFAKIAGLEVKSFTDLVANDTNQALIQMLQAMNDKGGFQALIPMFKDMGADGARAVSVLSTLAKKIDNVTEAQKLSNDSFAQATSLTDENNIKQETAQAKLDKAKNKFLETAVALGEKLYPAITMSMNGASYLIKVLRVLADNFGEIVNTLAFLGIAFATYTVTMNLAWLKTKLLVLETKALTASTFILNNVIKANPIGLLITLLTTAAIAMGMFNNKMKENIPIQEKEKDARVEEIDKLEILRGRLNKTNLSRDEQIAIIKELNTIAPDMLGNIDKETIKTGEASKEIEKYIKLKKIKKLIEDNENTIKAIEEQTSDIKASDPNKWLTKTQYYLKPLFDQDFLDKQVETKKNALIETNDKMLEDAKKLDIELTTKLFAIQSDFDKRKKPTVGAGAGISETEAQKAEKERKAALEKELKELEDKLKAEKAILKTNLIEKTTTEDAYNTDIINKDIKFYSDKIDILKKYNELTGDAKLDKANADAALTEDSYKKETKAIEDKHKDGLDELKNQLSQKLIIEEDYAIMMLASEIALAEKKLEIDKKYGKDTTELERELKNKNRELTDKITNKSDKGKSYLEKLDLEAMEIKLSYQRGILNKEDYENKLLEIATKRVDEELKLYMKLADHTNKLSSDGLQAAANFKDASLTRSETNYNKEVAALDDKLNREIISQEEYDAQKKTLETKYQEEQKEIKKKYAGIELALNIAQIISSTALAVMNSLKMGLPWSIPFGIMAGIQGASQIALATAQYNQIQGLEDGLYPVVTRQQDGKQFSVSHTGAMTTGVFGKPSVLVGEAGPELVVDNRRFRKIMRENPQVIDYIVNGYQSGKYPSLSKDALSVGTHSQNKIIEQNTRVMNQLLDTINSSSIYGLRDKLNKANKTVQKTLNKFE